MSTRGTLMEMKGKKTKVKLDESKKNIRGEKRMLNGQRKKVK